VSDFAATSRNMKCDSCNNGMLMLYCIVGWVEVFYVISHPLSQMDV
jgi:hypothetical protein